MAKSAKIRKLLAKNLSAGEIAKQLKVPANYVHTIKWLDKKKKKQTPVYKKATFKSPRSKLIQSVFQTVKDIQPAKQRFASSKDFSPQKLLAELEAAEKKLDFASKPTKLVVQPQYKEAALKMLGAKEADLVNKPPHYTTGGVETLDFIEAKDLNYRLGNVVKYVVRCGKKNTDPVQDLEKAMFYLKREIEARRNA